MSGSSEEAAKVRRAMAPCRWRDDFNKVVDCKRLIFDGRWFSWRKDEDKEVLERVRLGVLNDYNRMYASLHKTIREYGCVVGFPDHHGNAKHARTEINGIMKEMLRPRSLLRHQNICEMSNGPTTNTSLVYLFLQKHPVKYDVTG